MSYPIQKVLHYSEAKAKRNFVLQTYAVMEKLDGWLLYADYIDGKWGKLKSRADREIPSVDYLNEYFPKALVPKQDTRLIFEATIPNMFFHELNGVLNRKSEKAENVVLHLHDVVPLNIPDTPFKVRYHSVVDFHYRLSQVLGEQAQIVPILEVTGEEEVFFDLFKQITSRGGEGIILKNYEAGYFFGKRNSNMMKIKEEVTKDLAVVGLVEGEGKYAGTLGALIVQGRDGVKHQVSGMTDSQRELWWSNRDTILGQVVEVKAMKELPDGSLREPRFKCVRYDKTLADID